MHAVAARLFEQGQVQAVVDILDEAIVLETADLELMRLAIQAIAETEGIQKALKSFARIQRIQIDTQRLSQSELDSLFLQLCKNWIRSATDKEEPLNGWIAYAAAENLSPNDPEIQLLGAELAISERDWGRADELLSDHDFPQDLRDKVQNLEVLVTTGKRDEDVVQIRFVPGQDQIPIEAYLEGEFKQKFLIDTGASLVTIPTETAETLGIRLDDSTPLVPVSTASGTGMAYEVTLDSIELKGLRVRHIKALILDIPANPELGLLGNNFLKHFHVEIDQKNGILRLKER
jgi:clan AA aspartic protease (TIGR02281 family)